MSNAALNKAKVVKNDEFYTRFEDIEKELLNYKDFLKDKVILSPCDRNIDEVDNKIIYPQYFGFSKFFKKYSKDLGIVKNFYSYYNEREGGVPFQQSIREFAKKYPSGVVITNPPFSQKQELFKILDETGLDFILIMPDSSLFSSKWVSDKFIENKVFCGFNALSKFLNDKNEIRSIGSYWLTSFDISDLKNNENKYEKVFYEKDKYQFLDNSDILYIDKVKNIPFDYKGLMAVPSTLWKTNKNDIHYYKNFHIIHRRADNYVKYSYNTIATVNGKTIYTRLVVKRR